MATPNDNASGIASPAPAAAIALPPTCPHCHAARDYSEHHGIHFCNSCGRKVLSAPKPASPSAASTAAFLAAATAGSPERNGVGFAAMGSAAATPQGAGFNTPPRSPVPAGVDPSTAEEDDDIVTFKHSMQSPPPPSRTPQGSGNAGFDFNTAPTPAPASRSEKMAQAFESAAAATPLPAPALASVAAASSSASAASSSAASPAPSSSSTAAPSAAAQPAQPASAAGSNQITLSEEEFAAMEASIRSEVLAASAAENEILAMEFDALERSNASLLAEKTELAHRLSECDSALQSTAALQAEKRDLTRTLEEMMDSYDKLVSEAAQRKADFMAEQGILETELSQLRSQFTAHKTELLSLREKHARLQSEQEETLQLSNEQLTLVEKLRGENDTFRTQYEKLHKQAQEKLSASAQEYRAVLQRIQEKDTSLSQLSAELEHERTRAQAAEDLVSQLQLSATHATTRASTAETAAESLRLENLDLKAQLRGLSAQLAETQQKLEESTGVSARYRDQVLEARERLRDMDDASMRMRNLEMAQARAESDMSSLTKENQKLKSQLFDSFQTEKALKAQLEGQQAAAAFTQRRGEDVSCEHEWNEMIPVFSRSAFCIFALCVLSAGSGLSSSAVSDVGKLVRLEGEVASLQSALASKDKEHAELMAICTDLISQVETLKGQQQ